MDEMRIFARKMVRMDKMAAWALWFLTRADKIEDPLCEYGSARGAARGPGQADDLRQAQELLSFVREAQRRACPVPSPQDTLRVTRTLRVYIGGQELKIRPMAKSILLLFLRHPEGITLKRIGDHREELSSLYRRACRCDTPAQADQHLEHLLDIFNNELNVNICRVNTAVAALIDSSRAGEYRIAGRPGEAKSIALDRSQVVWE